MNSLNNEINYSFKNPNLLKSALTHSSYSNEFGGESYERLEFLGDAVLELVVSDYIYKFNELDSGILSKLRAGLVSTSYLKGISESLKLDKLVLKSKSLSMLSDKTKADLFESLIGAIYLDGGLENAQKIIQKFVIVNDLNIQNVLKNCIDYKTKLQEYLQKIGKHFEYRVVSESGLNHEKIFEVELCVDSIVVSNAKGKSIHIAQENCAEIYLKRIEK